MPGGQAIAVKLLRAELSQDPEFARRFEREIEVAQRVRSSHVAQLIDACPEANEPWLASAYVCGPSLLELVREMGPLPSRDVMLIAAGIAQALAAIHATGAVHRDLKPDRFLTADDRLGDRHELRRRLVRQANIVVTGRIAQYYDTSYCGSYHWTTWKSDDFPALAYTVCFRNA